MKRDVSAMTPANDSRRELPDRELWTPELPSDDVPLSHCLLKLERARYHLAELRSAILDWRDPVSYDLTRTQEEDPEGRPGTIKFTYYAEQTRPVPDTWGIILADAMHNLHSALDQLGWELARLKCAPTEP